MDEPFSDRLACGEGQDAADPASASGEPLLAILVGSGELRRNTGAGPAYIGYIVLGEATIGLMAEVAQDLRGRSFAITARLDPADFTQTELDRLLTAPSRRGAGLGGPRRLPPIGPIKDDPIPFEAA